MKKLLCELLKKINEGEDTVLVGVIASSGSTPRGAGARMLIGSSGRITGTIGGGAVEYRCETIAGEMLKSKSSGEYDFSLTRNDVENLGMICGGDVKVYFSYISGSDSYTKDVLLKAQEHFAENADMWLISELSNSGKLGICTKEGLYGIKGIDIDEKFLLNTARFTTDNREFYIEKINSSSRVYIFGCGHVARELAPVLIHLGFKVTVTDDREDFADKSFFPDEADVKKIDFEHIADSVSLSENDYAVIMTRGHACDTIIQAQVLSTKACYIGVIGSKHKKAGVFEILRQQGYGDADLSRITTPIGLEIKAETPEEIAISIAAQLILKRAEMICS